ncbi:unnamed protein product [Euphydryas editha]|uniref:Uncharacterized protein n=1 Tax=Euphydryas editha TaxID=104508 RepID=A0AAU9VBU2_EUPED|nr:unnamed protein product [Euphydryas editha]
MQISRQPHHYRLSSLIRHADDSIDNRRLNTACISESIRMEAVAIAAHAHAPCQLQQRPSDIANKTMRICRLRPRTTATVAWSSSQRTFKFR